MPNETDDCYDPSFFPSPTAKAPRVLRLRPGHILYLVEAVRETDLPTGPGVIVRAGQKQIRGRAYRVLDKGPGAYTQAGERIPLCYDKGALVLADPDKVNELLIGNTCYLTVAENYIYGELVEGAP